MNNLHAFLLGLAMREIESLPMRTRKGYPPHSHARERARRMRKQKSAAGSVGPVWRFSRSADGAAIWERLP